MNPNSSLAPIFWGEGQSLPRVQYGGVGVMVGETTYQGNIPEFMPLLSCGEKVHLGKATTFGLGKIKISQPV